MAYRETVLPRMRALLCNERPREPGANPQNPLIGAVTLALHL